MSSVCGLYIWAQIFLFREEANDIGAGLLDMCLYVFSADHTYFTGSATS